MYTFFLIQKLLFMPFAIACPLSSPSRIQNSIEPIRESHFRSADPRFERRRPTFFGYFALAVSVLDQFSNTFKGLTQVGDDTVNSRRSDTSGLRFYARLKFVFGLQMSMGSDTSWVGRKPLRRLGGMSDALSLAADLGFSVNPPPSQEELQNLSNGTGEKSDDLIRVLRELTSVQRKIADLQVELQGRKDDKNVAHLTHVSEMEKKCETLARITTILKDVIQNKDRIIARLQQPYSLDCIPVEAEFQKQFSELLMKAASDYGALTASVADFQWSQNFKESPSIWGEMLRPIPGALASCTRFFEAMSAMRESFATLQNLRVGHSSSSLPTTPAKDLSQKLPIDSECVTPPLWRNESSFDDMVLKSMRRQEIERHEVQDEDSEVGDALQVDGSSHRRLSWPPVKKSGL